MNSIIRSVRGSYAQQTSLLLLTYFLTLHAILLVWDFGHPNVFMNADRAASRLAAMKSMLSAIDSPARSLSQAIESHGIIGDYLFHAILYGIGGKVLILFVQIALAGLSFLTVFWLSKLLIDKKLPAIAIALIYMHLPYSLIYPHMLCSEALFSPLVVFSFAALASHILLEKHRSWLIASALMIGIAAIIRPIAVLWPFVVVAVGWIFIRIPFKNLSTYLLVALSPMLVWIFIMKSCSGEFSMGKSGYDLNHNLYGRVELISKTMPPKIAEHVRSKILKTSPVERELTLTKYIYFVIKHPIASLKHYKNDLIAFTAKSGIEAVLLDYIGYDSESRSTLRATSSNWRRSMDQHGVFHVILATLKRNPYLMTATFMGSLVIMTLWSGYLLRLWQAFQKRLSRSPRMTAFLLLLALLPPYVFATSTLAWNIHSRHRAPVEFSIVILAITGFCGLKKEMN